MNDNDFAIGMDAFNESTPPTDSRILADKFKAYKWIRLPFRETFNKSSGSINLYLIDAGEPFILKRLKLCSPNEVGNYQKLQQTLDKEMDELKSLRSRVPATIPELVDISNYRDALDGFACVDLLFKVQGTSFRSISDSVNKNQRVETVEDIVDFHCRLEENNVPHGVLLDYNNLVANDSSKVIVLGLGLVEAMLIHGVEASRQIGQEKLRKLASYVKIVSPYNAPSNANSASNIADAMKQPLSTDGRGWGSERREYGPKHYQWSKVE